MQTLDLMVDLIKRSKVWALGMEFYGTWQEVAMCHRTPYIRTKINIGHFYKSMVRLKMSILQIWVTWASKSTFKNLRLCSIKILVCAMTKYNISCVLLAQTHLTMMNHLTSIFQIANMSMKG